MEFEIFTAGSKLQLYIMYCPVIFYTDMNVSEKPDAHLQGSMFLYSSTLILLTQTRKK